VIYGPGRSLLSSRVGISVGPVLLQIGGSQPLPYCYVENCAAAVKQAGLVPGIEGEVFNVVDDDLPTGGEIVRTLRRHGSRVRPVRIPSRAIGPLSTLYEWYSRWSQGQLPDVITRYKSEAIWKPLWYSNTKAKRRLNWRPKVKTTDGLRITATHSHDK
jgi:nucleoside-diphosphate-sugar epimerase